MAEIFTEKEVEEYLRQEVQEAGGAAKWLKKHKMFMFYKHILHMFDNGSAATLPQVLDTLGFVRKTVYEPKTPN